MYIQRKGDEDGVGAYRCRVVNLQVKASICQAEDLRRRGDMGGCVCNAADGRTRGDTLRITPSLLHVQGTRQ